MTTLGNLNEEHVQYMKHFQMKCLQSILQIMYINVHLRQIFKSNKMGLSNIQQLGIEFKLYQKKMEIRDLNLVNTLLFVSIGGSFHQKTHLERKTITLHQSSHNILQRVDNLEANYRHARVPYNHFNASCFITPMNFYTLQAQLRTMKSDDTS